MNEELQQTIDRLRERGLTDMEISNILSNTGEYGSDSSVINYVVEDYNKKKTNGRYGLSFGRWFLGVEVVRDTYPRGSKSRLNAGFYKT